MDMTQAPSIQGGAQRYQESIDSHFSLGQNIINFKVMSILSERSLEAKDRPNVTNLKSYYNAITEVQECFSFIMPIDRLKDFKEKEATFLRQYYDMLDGKLAPTDRNVMAMLFTLQNMRFIVTNTLQSLFSYFYRMSKRQKRGFHNLDSLHEENIFK